MLVVVREEAWSAIAEISDFIAGGQQLFGEPGRAQRRRSLVASRGKCRGTRGRANQGNLLRLTDDFDRQGLAPCLVFPVYRARLSMTGSYRAQGGKSHQSCTARFPAGHYKLFSGAAPAQWSPIPAAA